MENNSNEKAKETKAGIKTGLRNAMLLHPGKMIVGVVLVLLLAAWICCGIAVGFDGGKLCEGVCPWIYLWRKLTFEEGLSLLVGYAGAAATVILGAITLRFSFKVDQRDVIAKLRNFKVSSILLYDMFENFAPEEVLYEEARGFHFLMRIELSGNAPDYELEVNRVWWEMSGDENRTTLEGQMCGCQIYVENAAETVIYIFFDEPQWVNGAQVCEEDKRNKISFLYNICDYEPSLLERNMRQRRICMDMSIKEKIWVKNKKKNKREKYRNEYKAEFKILVENKAHKRNSEKYVPLCEIQHNFELERIR